MAANDDDVYVMVNGMPGPMATAAAEACLRKGLKLAPFAMTGPALEVMTISVWDEVTERSGDVRLIPANEANLPELQSQLAGFRATTSSEDSAPLLLAIDYTHPSAVNDNARFYAKESIPFVMGTTGGDRDQLMKDMEEAKHFAVIAPNMAKQIVAMQAALEDLATKYPGAFEGYSLACTESHQVTKADTSGTAKAVIDSLVTLNQNSNDKEKTFTYDDIEMIRNEQEAQERLGVPSDAMDGHAFHTYTLTSPDESTQFGLMHNVAGRTIYAEGTADAVAFLAKKVRQAEGSPGRVFSMINVLEEGALN